MTNGNSEKMRSIERFSRRFQSGVEIIEHETINTTDEPNEQAKRKGVRTPQLVIGDALTRSKVLIAKSRAQLGEVDSYLKSITRRPMNAK